jgi:hypothetical protein
MFSSSIFALDIENTPITIPRYIRKSGCKHKLSKLKVWAIPTAGFGTGSAPCSVFDMDGTRRYHPGIKINPAGIEDALGPDWPWMDVLIYWGTPGHPGGAPAGYPYPRRAHSEKTISSSGDYTISRVLSVDVLPVEQSWIKLPDKKVTVTESTAKFTDLVGGQK